MGENDDDTEREKERERKLSGINWTITRENRAIEYVLRLGKINV